MDADFALDPFSKTRMTPFPVRGTWGLDGPSLFFRAAAITRTPTGNIASGLREKRQRPKTWPNCRGETWLAVTRRFVFDAATFFRDVSLFLLRKREQVRPGWGS